MSSKAVTNIKTVIIVVLFLTTILLLYLIWGGSTDVSVSDLLSSFTSGREELEVGSTVCSTSVVLSNGDGSYRSVSDETLYYFRTLEKFKNLCDNGTVMAGEITKAQYEEIVRDYETLLLRFGYSVPFSQFCSFNNIRGTSTFDSIGYVSTFAMSTAADDSLFVADEKSGRYYRLVSDNPGEAFTAPLNYRGDVTYYEISRVLGSGSNRLFPIVSESTMAEMPYTEYYTADPEERNEIARALFGDTLDFVRRISDSFGNYTFMYGYGQKTLTLGADGSIEYKAEAGTGSSGGFFEDLKTAKNFAALTGIYNNISISDSSLILVLVDAQMQGSGKSAAYTFRFLLNDGLYDIYGPGGQYAMEITVEKGKVTAFRSNIILAQNQTAEARPVADAANVIAADCASSEALAKLLDSFDSMEQVYYKQEGILVPAWRLRLMDGTQRFYDLYTGEVLK